MSSNVYVRNKSTQIYLAYTQKIVKFTWLNFTETEFTKCAQKNAGPNIVEGQSLS